MFHGVDPSLLFRTDGSLNPGLVPGKDPKLTTLAGRAVAQVCRGFCASDSFQDFAPCSCGACVSVARMIGLLLALFVSLFWPMHVTLACLTHSRSRCMGAGDVP